MAADSTAKFAVSLEDETSGAAEAAAAALQKLHGKILADQKALREMQAAMRRLQGGTSVSIDTFRSLSAQIEQKKSAIATATENYVNLGGSFRKVRKPAEDASNAVGKAGASIRDLATGAKGAVPGIEGLITRVSDLAAGLGAGGLVGVAVVAVAAMAALAVGFVAVTAKVAAFALQSADAARAALLLATAAAGSAAAGTALAAAVGRVSKSVALGRSEVAAFGNQLARAGLAGADLEHALEAVAITAATGGDASALMRQIEAAKKAGKSIEAIADKTRTALGGVAKAQMLSFSTQIQKAKENITGLFANVKIEPFLKAMQRILSLFDSSTSSGRALKALAEGLLDPLFAGIAKTEPAASAFFKGLVIGALLLGIAVLTVRNKLRDMFKGVDFETHKTTFAALGITAAVFAGALALAAVAVLAIGAVIGGSLAAGAAIFGAIVAGIVAVAVGIGMLAAKIASGVVSAVTALKGKLSEFVELGANFIKGLASGITSGLSTVVSAALGVAKGAVSAVKGALKISSPSKVFAELGENTAAGMAVGMEAGAKDVEAAGMAMVAPPSPAAGGAAGGSAAAGGGKTFHITLNGVKDAQQLADDPSLRDRVIKLFEDAAANMGAPLEAGA